MRSQRHAGICIKRLLAGSEGEREMQWLFQAGRDLTCIWCLCFKDYKMPYECQIGRQSLILLAPPRNEEYSWIVEMNANDLPPMVTHPKLNDEWWRNSFLCASGILTGYWELLPREHPRFTLCWMLVIQEALANSWTGISLTNLLLFWVRNPVILLDNPTQIEICALFFYKIFTYFLYRNHRILGHIGEF